MRPLFPNLPLLPVSGGRGVIREEATLNLPIARGPRDGERAPNAIPESPNVGPVLRVPIK